MLYLVVPSGCSNVKPVHEIVQNFGAAVCKREIEGPLVCPQDERRIVVAYPEYSTPAAKFDEIVRLLQELSKDREVWVVTANAVLASDLSKLADEVYVATDGEVKGGMRVGNMTLVRLDSHVLFCDVLECVQPLSVQTE